jgi:hypothetical protein
VRDERTPNDPAGTSGAGALEPARPGSCLSDFALDRLWSGELTLAGQAAAEAHLDFCARCRARSLSGVAGPLPPRRDVPFAASGPPQRSARPAPRDQGPRWSRAPARRLAAGGLAAAVVAALVAGLAPRGHHGDGERIKGTARVGFYVKHGETIRRGAAGEIVAPGDALRFTVTTPTPIWLAVLSRDGAGHASVYYPTGGGMAEIGPARDLALPASTVLDEVTGPEQIFALFCAAPADLGGLRRALDRNGAVAAPPGCLVDRLSIEKRDAGNEGRSQSERDGRIGVGAAPPGAGERP